MSDTISSWSKTAGRWSNLKHNKKFWEEQIAYFPWYDTAPHWKRRIQQFFYCCVCIRYCDNVSTEPLPSNDRIFTDPLSSNNKEIFIEPLPSNDKETSIEPFPSWPVTTIQFRRESGAKPDCYIAPGPRQHCYFWFRVPRDLWPYFTVWRLWEPLKSLSRREAGWLVNWFWPSPVQSPAGLMTIFYCLTTLGDVAGQAWIVISTPLIYINGDVSRHRTSIPYYYDYHQKTLWTCIREVLGSNIERGTCYHYWEFSWSPPPDICRDGILFRPRLLSSKSFPIHHSSYCPVLYTPDIERIVR
jgi:hypothetical protein